MSKTPALTPIPAMERDSLVARLNASAVRMDLTAKQILNAVASGSDYGCSEAAAVCRDAAAALSRPEQVATDEIDAILQDSFGFASGADFIRKVSERIAALTTTAAPPTNLQQLLEAYDFNGQEWTPKAAAPLQADASAPASPAIGVQAVKALADRVRALPLVDQPAGWEERRKIADELESLSALHPAPEAASVPEPYIEVEPGEHQEVLDALSAHNSGEE